MPKLPVADRRVLVVPAGRGGDRGWSKRYGLSCRYICLAVFYPDFNTKTHTREKQRVYRVQVGSRSGVESREQREGERASKQASKPCVVEPVLEHDGDLSAKMRSNLFGGTT